MPELVNNINIDNLELKATVDAQDRLIEQTLEVAISGVDASGYAHILATSIDLNLSEFNQTTRYGRFNR